MLRIAKRSAVAIYYEDPDKPGFSRHKQCFEEAGIDPEQAGYRRLGNVCWPCYEIANVHISRERTFAGLGKVITAGLLFQAASDEAFRLAQSVRCASGHGIVRRQSLEQERRFAVQLRRFRSAWAEASSAAAFMKRPFGLMYFTLLGVGIGDLDPCLYLSHDPTLESVVDMANLERPAGWLARINRIIGKEARRTHRQMIDAGEAEHHDAVALALAKKFKVSLPCLARVIGGELARQQARDADGKPVVALAEADKVYGRWRTQKSRQQANRVQPSANPPARAKDRSRR